MKKFLLTTAFFMGFSFLASAQENAVKSSTRLKLKKQKLKKPLTKKSRNNKRYLKEMKLIKRSSEIENANYRWKS